MEFQYSTRITAVRQSMERELTKLFVFPIIISAWLNEIDFEKMNRFACNHFSHNLQMLSFSRFSNTPIAITEPLVEKAVFLLLEAFRHLEFNRAWENIMAPVETNAEEWG